MTPTRVRGCNTAETGNIEGDSLAGQTPREGLPRTAGMPILRSILQEYGQVYSGVHSHSAKSAGIWPVLLQSCPDSNSHYSSNLSNASLRRGGGWSWKPMRNPGSLD